MGIWALEAIYLASSVPCNALKMLALYGLIFTAFDNGFIWCNFYLDFIAQNTIKKQPHQQWQLRLSQNFKLCKQAYIWKWLGSFLNQLHSMVNWLVSLHDNFSQIDKFSIPHRKDRNKAVPWLETSYDYAVIFMKLSSQVHAQDHC